MLDVLIVLAFIAYGIASGLRHRRRASAGAESYFLADRSLSGWKAGTSMAATQFAADTPLLVTGLVATGGVFGMWRLTIYGLSFLLLAYVFSGPWRRSGVLTDAELTEIRYSGSGTLALRLIKAVYYGTVINCAVLAMVLVAAIRICERFLPWHQWLPRPLFDAIVGLVQITGIELASSASALDPAVATADNLLSVGAIVAFTAAYSTAGGLRSVVATDVVQFGLAMVATVAYAWVVSDHAGGLTAIPGRLETLYGADRARALLDLGPPEDWAIAGPLLGIVALQWLFQMNSDGTGYLAQRVMACRDDTQAQRAGVVFAWLQIVLRTTVWVVIAVGLLVVYPMGPEVDAATREITFVAGVDELLPPGLRGLMLTGLLAALASTIDTHLNWGASYWSRDIYARWWVQHRTGRQADDRTVVRVARISGIAIVVVALAIVPAVGSIQTAWSLTLLLGSGVGAVLVLRWTWERINLASELAAIVVSLVAAPILLWTVDAEWVRLAIMAGLSTFAAVVAPFVTPSTDPAVRDAFYRKVRPPGWWPRAAAACDERPSAPRARLRRGLALVAMTAGSMYLLLGAAVRLALPVPDVSPLAIAGQILAGLLLLPPVLTRVARKLRGA